MDIYVCDSYVTSEVGIHANGFGLPQHTLGY